MQLEPPSPPRVADEEAGDAPHGPTVTMHVIGSEGSTFEEGTGVDGADEGADSHL